MLNLQGKFGTQLEYHLSITTPETPSYTPKTKKVPRLLARNPQNSSIKIDDVQSFQPGFPAGQDTLIPLTLIGSPPSTLTSVRHR